MDKTITSTESPVTVTTIQYGGITSATETGLNTATLSFALAPTNENISGINLDCQIKGGAIATLATASAASTSYPLTGLDSGATYTCSAHAVVNGIEDSNTVTQSFQTPSVSFGSGNGAGGTYDYRGFQLVQAYGDAPGAPAGTPSQREVVLTWLPFTGSTSLTKYQISRIAAGNGPIDMTVNTPCTATTTTSCLVSTSTGDGSVPQSATDSNIGSEPMQYEYVVSEIVNGRAEEIPSAPVSPFTAANFETFVPIPPPNMVLTQRDSVNYEMCTNVGIATSGTASDPLNHQRCPYAGMAATPYNDNPNGVPIVLDAGYYDFGYDLFVDRWVTACNWTPSTGGGMCGAGGTSGNCYGSGTPANTVGINGNVYWDYTNESCLIMDSGVWQYVWNMGLADWKTALTNAPSQTYKKPPFNLAGATGYSNSLTAWYLGGAFQACSMNVDPNYGAKRLPRRREQIAFSAFPMGGDPGYYAGNIGSLESGASIAAYHVCNTNYANGLAHTGFNTDEFASTSANFETVDIGSVATSNCLTRYGAQDVIGNTLQYTSEEIYWVGTSPYSAVTLNSYDSGDTEWTALKFDGTELLVPTSATYLIDWNHTRTPYFSMVMGAPINNSDNGAAPAFGSAFEINDYMPGGNNYDGTWYGGLNGSTAYAAVLYGASAGTLNGWGNYGEGRFGALPLGNQTPAWYYNVTSTRCVLPAE